MFYVLFTYSKGRKERDFRAFRIDDDVIKFIHENYEKIDIAQIIAAERSFRLGLVETEDLIKSELIERSIDAADPVPFPDSEEKSIIPVADEIIKGKDLSGMEKIADDIEKEMTEEEIMQKNKEVLAKADNAIDTAKKDLEKKPDRLIINPAEKPEKKTQMGRIIDKADWLICPDCNRRKVAPWNESGRCSHCQQYKKKPKKDVIDKKDWPTCPVCKIRKMAPWNTVGKCSYCQGHRGKKK